jgi:hypothetical protein
VSCYIFMLTDSGIGNIYNRCCKMLQTDGQTCWVSVLNSINVVVW